MEEVSHIFLQHAPTRLEPCPATGLPLRTFAKSKEKEAYGVAGAALVPFNGLSYLLSMSDDTGAIAERFGVSTDLVRMRIQVTRARERA